MRKKVTYSLLLALLCVTFPGLLPAQTTLDGPITVDGGWPAILKWETGQLQRSADAIVWDRTNFRLLLDADADQGVEIFSIYQNTATSSGNTAAVNFNLGTGKSWLSLGGNLGIGTTIPQSKLSVNGKIDAHTLELTGGSDLSEAFDILGSHQVQAGMVVSIDPDHPGRLRLSEQAYDRTVAGILSGAGGVSSGMLMGQKGSIADGAHPVALSGRVFVWCDASGMPIRPGDLLTTSELPGHAMKAVDHERSNGAILGKAMTAMPEGRGLVLALVSLQ